MFVAKKKPKSSELVEWTEPDRERPASSLLDKLQFEEKMELLHEFRKGWQQGGR